MIEKRYFPYIFKKYFILLQRKRSYIVPNKEAWKKISQIFFSFFYTKYKFAEWYIWCLTVGGIRLPFTSIRKLVEIWVLIQEILSTMTVMYNMYNFLEIVSMQIFLKLSSRLSTDEMHT